jgi:hypothetical protein
MRKQRAVFFMMILVFCFLNPDVSWSWRVQSKKSQGFTQGQTEKLSRQQRKVMVSALVRKVLKHHFFTDEELPHMLVVSELQIAGDDLNTTPKEFSDSVLNILLSHPLVMVMNQDLKMDLSLDYQLTFYLSEYETRKKGLLLGADYVVTGRMFSKILETEKGKPKKSYTAVIEVKDIHTDSVMVSESCTVEKNKRKRK